jgi:hypothetical protein
MGSADFQTELFWLLLKGQKDTLMFGQNEWFQGP